MEAKKLQEQRKTAGDAGLREQRDFTVIGHYYEPIPYYGGKVLKYAGLACPMNRDFMMAKPGMLMLDAYKGDRINAQVAS